MKTTTQQDQALIAALAQASPKALSLLQGTLQAAQPPNGSLDPVQRYLVELILSDFFADEAERRATIQEAADLLALAISR